MIDWPLADCGVIPKRKDDIKAAQIKAEILIMGLCFPGVISGALSDAVLHLQAVGQ